MPITPSKPSAGDNGDNDYQRAPVRPAAHPLHLIRPTTPRAFRSSAAAAASVKRLDQSDSDSSLETVNNASSARAELKESREELQTVLARRRLAPRKKLMTLVSAPGRSLPNTIDLADYGLGDGYGAFLADAVAPREELHTLSLRNSRLSPRVAATILEALPPNVRHLDLSENPNAARRIARHLERGALSLISLNCSSVKLSSIAAGKLCVALKAQAAITSLVRCNVHRRYPSPAHPLPHSHRTSPTTQSAPSQPQSSPSSLPWTAFTVYFLSGTLLGRARSCRWPRPSCWPRPATCGAWTSRGTALGPRA